MKSYKKTFNYIKKDGSVSSYVAYQKYQSKNRDLDVTEKNNIVMSIISGKSISDIKNEYNISTQAILYILIDYVKNNIDHVKNHIDHVKK